MPTTLRKPPPTAPPFVLPAAHDKAAYVREMFDAIAPRYDVLNSVLSVRLHHHWRRVAADKANLKVGDMALDVCTGTGDFAFELARRVGKTGRVVATDFSPPMLRLGQGKTGGKHAAGVQFLAADTQNLPFPDNTFDAVTVGFGIRNVADMRAGICEMARVTRPGGRVVLLEFSQPQNAVFAALYQWYSFHVLPVVGGLVSGRKAAYTYLPSSVEAWASRETVAQTMRSAGLTDVVITDLMLGTVAVHSALKPGLEGPPNHP